MELRMDRAHLRLNVRQSPMWKPRRARDGEMQIKSREKSTLQRVPQVR
jgi:hypothetical protein